MKVILSFDTEFSIGGAFQNRQKTPMSKEIFEPNGDNSIIGFKEVLATLNQYQTRATFFVEALQSHYFSEKEMKRYIDLLLKDGHDLQLHTHPCWEFFANKNWKELPSSPPPIDNYFENSTREIVQSLRFALGVFDKWGVPKPVAFRAGNLMACIPLYKALSECGINLASNVGLPYFMPKEEELKIENCVKTIHGVSEIPITSFTSFANRKKLLTITGCSALETRSVLKDCHAQGIEIVVILTHIHEFTKGKRANRINLSRLKKLCKLVNEHPDYSFACFDDLSLDKLALTSTRNTIKSNWLSGIITIIQNQINDRFSFI